MTTTPPVGQSIFGLTVNFSGLVGRFRAFRRSISKRQLLLEFAPTSLTIAEARFTGDDIEYNHLKRVSLPAGVCERGVPNEPEKMATLIKSLCEEDNIYAHRAVAVVPPEAAFTKLIQVPAELNIQEAWDFINDPTCGIQIPIPLQQTDFDIIPVALPFRGGEDQGFQTYFLSSIPKKIVDQLVQTLQQSDLELYGLELTFFSQLRLIATEVSSLLPAEYCLMLELLPECTHLTVATASGPIAVERMSAVREFPEPDLLENQKDIDYKFAEAAVIADEKYLPISELDLRVLAKEVSQYIRNFSLQRSTLTCKKVYLSGVNSAHPDIAELLSLAIGYPVEVVRAMGASGVGNVSFSSALLHQSLGRILGIGLTIIPEGNQDDLSLTKHTTKTFEVEETTRQSTTIDEKEEEVEKEVVAEKIEEIEEEWPSINFELKQEEDKESEPLEEQSLTLGKAEAIEVENEKEEEVEKEVVVEKIGEELNYEPEEDSDFPLGELRFSGDDN